MKNSNLYKRIVSEVNIYNAIYSLESYTFEKELLNSEDIGLYNQLTDKYNKPFIDQVVTECKDSIIDVLNSEDFFEIEVFFKPKKYDSISGKVEFRPIHTARLKIQICIVALLNVLMFDDSGEKRKLSDISRLLPSNFYGNIPSIEVATIFKPWNNQYQEYSQKAIEAQRLYNRSKRFSHEINLDIKKFYPSIDPLFIKDFILGKWPITFKADDFICLEALLRKLLFFKLKISEDCLDLYYPADIVEQIKEKELYFNVGLPQGLPQAYFFGNICMSLISKEIENVFKGDAYYYVDDSIIYTKAKKEDFFDNINRINNKLNEQIKSIIKPQKNNSRLRKFSELINYEIFIYNTPDGKSTISPINPSISLHFFAKPASAISFEIIASMDEFEDYSLQMKIESIISLIEYRLREIKEGNLPNSKDENTLKLLKRYKKFYTNRLNILKSREDNFKDEEDIDKFIVRYGLNDSIKKTCFFEKLEDDVFSVESKLFIKQLHINKPLQSSLIKNIQAFEAKIGRKRLLNHYFSKVLNGYIQFLDQNNIIYKFLESKTNTTIVSFDKVKKSRKIDFIKSLIQLLTFPDCKASQSQLTLQNSFSQLLKDYKIGYSSFVYKNSSNFIRRIVNAIISKAFSVSLNDSCNLIKQDNRAISYDELRILMLVRSKQFQVDMFAGLVHKILKEFDQNINVGKIDLSLFEVLPTFSLYVRDPEKIDNLILIHKYVNGIWKNGSKFLHFYTLHNEEHSIELIHNSVKITKAIDYLSIKKEDYYLLFLSCYLHDIAMVLYPRLDEFTEENQKTDLIYSEWKADIDKITNIETEPKSDIKNIILEYYNKVNDYFETKIRNNHHKVGSNFIKNQSDLGFIEPASRRLVADISEAHCYDAKDVYKLKSKALHDICDEKYLMIILRLADLLDMSKDRVSINILRQNINNMSDISKYHWISHLAIDTCSIDSFFPPFDSSVLAVSDDFKLREIIQIKIGMNTKLFTTSKTKKCKDMFCFVEPQDNPESKMSIFINRGGYCNSHCNFVCSWITSKHDYLFKELIELQKYLDRNTNNIFRTEIKVIFSFENSSLLPSDYMDIIKKEID